MEETLQAARLVPQHRWEATLVNFHEPHAQKNLQAEGVSPFVQKPRGASCQYINRGAIGCFLSHKKLLQHLATLDCPPNHGHLVFEDDVQVTPYFWDHFQKLQSEIPSDWDMLFLGKRDPKGEMISKNVMRLHNPEDGRGNYGTENYIVRHSFLPTLLQACEFLHNEIDLMWNPLYEKCKAQTFHPSLIRLHPDKHPSDLGAIQSGV